VASGAVALGALAGCSGSETGGEAVSSPTTGSGPRPLPAPDEAPFDTVVVLMMENRSFDHFLGWLPGANGRQAGLQYLDTNGAIHSTWSLAPDVQGCDFGDPDHSWQGSATQFNQGACDGFLKTAAPGDTFPIGYYGRDDLPILGTLATEYTTFDNYFCSFMGPTWPNRMYQWCATTDLTASGLFPGEDDEPSNLQLTIFDRLWEAGLTGAYYFHSEPMSGLFRSDRYDEITYPVSQFYDDAAAGKLANVVFVDPEFGTLPELRGTSNDFHPWGSLPAGENFVRTVHEALATSPQWPRMVVVLNFDEHGGFFDHVAPPRVRDDTTFSGDGPFPDVQQLGFRVPAVAMGPFASRRIVSSGPYEHCSILKMIEWRWGLEPMTTRDRYATNLAEALDFSQRRAPAVLPDAHAVVPGACPGRTL
jgi:phospholipase C